MPSKAKLLLHMEMCYQIREALKNNGIFDRSHPPPVFMFKISLTFYKICFMPYSTTLSLKKQTPLKKHNAVKYRGGGGRG